MQSGHAGIVKEYNPLLNRRNKRATDSSRALNQGDRVWKVEASNPRGHNPTAQIDSLNYGSDGIARSAILTSKSRSYTRPLIKLVPLFEPTLSGVENVDNFCQQKMKIVFHLNKIPMPYGTKVDLDVTDEFWNPPKDGSGEPILFFD